MADKKRLEGLPFSKGQSPDAGKPHVLPPHLSGCPGHPHADSLPAAARGLLALWLCSPGVEAYFWNSCSQGRVWRGAVPGASAFFLFASLFYDVENEPTVRVTVHFPGGQIGSFVSGLAGQSPARRPGLAHSLILLLPFVGVRS